MLSTKMKTVLKSRAGRLKSKFKAAADVFTAIGHIHSSEPKFFQEPTSATEEDPVAAFRANSFQTIKNAFDLAYHEDGTFKVNVDSIYSLLKALGLNPKNDSVMDLVRDACMEGGGDIDPKQFEEVVLSLVRTMDEQLWADRVSEKRILDIEAEAERAKLEADKKRRAEEIERAGFEKEENEEDEIEEQERQRVKEEERKRVEMEVDELYDNMKMAFRFIDADGDGFITTKDLYTLMMGMGEMLTDDELFGMFSVADVDCDGKVTYEDFCNFLDPKPKGEECEVKEPPSEADEIPDDQTEGETSDAQKTEEVPKSNPEPEVPDNKPPAVEELSEEEKERRKRRRQSMLLGYISITKPAVQTQEPERAADKSDENQKSPENLEKIPDTEISDKKEEATKEPGENSGTLQAIREEDEHSTCELGASVQGNDDTDYPAGRTTLAAGENKRKLLRQSSSASLKTRPNSAITGAGSESLGDSGIDTMDTVFGSEIREQPDVFDISDEETDSVVRDKESSHPKRRNSRSSLLYENTEDDEDMVPAYHVNESLSRVSSTESFNELNEEDKEESVVNRARNFVQEHMYIEIERVPTEEEVEAARRTEERLSRAELLQKAILRRSDTAPQLTVYSSNIKKGKQSVNGLSCSHIDIDLTCESPPKADIKSFRRFSERVQSARANRNQRRPRSSERAMSVVEIGENMSEKSYSHSEKQRWPVRPLTRPKSPRSPVNKGVQTSTGKGLITASIGSELLTQTTNTRTRKQRVQSAAPRLRGSGSVRTQSPVRPQSAHIPYTASKRMENAFTQVQMSGNSTIIQPTVNSNKHYPNKNLLTSYHHGFKSIWPIGRSANVIRSKRPFSAFEMNSYSRSIERNEFPFRAETPISTARSVDLSDGIITVSNKNIIKLELNTDKVRKPNVRNMSELVVPFCTPRSGR